MNIKINNFSPIPYYKILEIVRLYMLDNEKDKIIKETSKYPNVISYGRAYYIHCKKVKRSYVFTIWLAV